MTADGPGAHVCKEDAVSKPKFAMMTVVGLRLVVSTSAYAQDTYPTGDEIQLYRISCQAGYHSETPIVIDTLGDWHQLDVLQRAAYSCAAARATSKDQTEVGIVASAWGLGACLDTLTGPDTRLSKSKIRSLFGQRLLAFSRICMQLLSN